jgi:hypothetical protein
MPNSLNLSYNFLTDECLYPVIKYIFANYDCNLKFLNLLNNSISPFGLRTLLKAFALSPHKDEIKFLYGPVPLGISNIFSCFITKFDKENLNIYSNES